MRQMVYHCATTTAPASFQMKILHMGGFTGPELIVYRNAVRGNVIDAMSSVLRDMENLNVEFEFEV